MADREQSEFNSAISYLNRLNALFYVCDESAMALDAHNWFHALKALFRELSTEMKPDEIARMKAEAGKIQNLISIYANNLSKGRSEVSPELHNALEDYELSLRRVMRESGLQLKIAEDARRALR